MKLFSKIASAFVGIALAIGVGVAVSGGVHSKEVRADTANFTLSSAAGVTVDGVTASFAQGSGSSAPAWYSAGLRLYASNTVTISSSNTITGITFNWEKQGSKAFASVTSDVGSYSHPSAAGDGTWSGSATSVVFTLGGSGQLQLNTFNVTYTTGGGGSSTSSTSAPTSTTTTTSAPTSTSSEPVSSNYVLQSTQFSSNSAYTTTYTETINGLSWDIDANMSMTSCWRIGGKSLDAIERVFKSNDPVSGTIQEIQVSHNGISRTEVSVAHVELTVASDSSFTSVVETINLMPTFAKSTAGSFTFEATKDWTDCYYKIVFNVSNTSTSNGGLDFISATFVKGEAPTGKTLIIHNNTHSAGPFEVTYGDTSDYKFALGWDDTDSEVLRDGCSWVVSDETIIDYYVNGDTWLCYKPKNVGTTTITCSHEGYKNASTTITVVPGTIESVTVTGSMTKTSYYVGESWSNAGLTATATYDSGYSKDVTDEATWTYNPSAPATDVTSVVATATYGGLSGNSSAQTVTVTRTNPIQVLYTQSSGASVDVYGYYVGFLDGTGPVIMDGEYGIVIYNKTADVSGYTAKETILHVTGSISIYNGLYEVGSASISVASGSYDAPDTPVVYATAGGETADKASRLTTVTGTPTLTSGSFDDAAGTNDIKMNFAVGLNTIQVFYKKAAQTADSDAFAAVKDAVTNSTEITIKGFTGWYSGFQVQMNGYVPAAESYTAEEFAQDLLDQTDAVCTGYDGETNNKSAIEAIWSDLASDDKYPSLPAAQKTILANADRNESGTVVEQAMARYDYLTGKYELSNFINGRTPVSFSAPIVSNNNVGTDSAIIVVTVIAITSLSAIAVLLVIKRRKSIQ